MIENIYFQQQCDDFVSLKSFHDVLVFLSFYFTSENSKLEKLI